MTLLSMPADPRVCPILFGIAPPRANNPPEKTHRITGRRAERLAQAGVDGLMVYDIQNEDERTEGERPFPYLPPIDPIRYVRDYLDKTSAASLPKIVYQAVTGRSRTQLETFFADLDPRREATVLVGAPTRDAKRVTSLNEAYELRARLAPGIKTGGVAIPERHARKGDEHERLAAKQEAGCSFFVTQCIYDATGAKNMLSAYHYDVQDRGGEPARIILTLSPCGSAKTLEFMKWLGISFPEWIERELSRSDDTLRRSVAACLGVAEDLGRFCADRGIPFGYCVESVSIKKDEIDAAGELARRIGELVGHFGFRPFTR
ncbi:MAG: methylenetetrahydrofolate reductase [Spirochaetota bacterium]